MEKTRSELFEEARDRAFWLGLEEDDPLYPDQNVFDKENLQQMIVKLKKLSIQETQTFREVNKFNKSIENIPENIIEEYPNLRIILNRIKSNLLRNRIHINFNEFENDLFKLSNIAAKNTIILHLLVETITMIDGRIGSSFKHVVYTLSNNFIDSIIEILRPKMIVEEITSPGSDEDIADFILKEDIQIVGVKFEVIPKKRTKSNNGGFFNYVNCSKTDLKRLCIFTVEDLENIKRIDNCLVNCLIELNVDKDRIRALKQSMFLEDDGIKENRLSDYKYTPRKDFKRIAEIIDRRILLKELDGIKRKEYFGDETKEQITICLFKEHYFPKIRLEITKKALSNYEEYKDLKNFQRITKRRKYKDGFRYERTNQFKKFTTSDKIVIELFKLGYFQRNIILNKFEQSCHVSKDKTYYLNNIENEQKKFEIKKGGKPATMIGYADFECFTNKNNTHKPFLLEVIIEHNKKIIAKRWSNLTQSRIEKNSAFLNLCEYLTNKMTKDDITILYYHNLRYDFQFIEENVHMQDKLFRDGLMYQAVLIYNKKRIILRDSYKLIPYALKKFKEKFKLDFGKKEYIPYNLYNAENIQLQYVKYEEAKKFIDPKDWEEFEKASADYRIGEDFRHMRYMIDYLHFDCLTLYTGISILRNEMIRITGIDPISCISLSSLANRYMANEGAFENSYLVKGNLRDFIMQAVVGGRVCLKDNVKQYIIDEIVDFDACSLYPSAIYRLCKDYGGIPCGEIKNLTKEHLESIKNLSEENELNEDIPYYIVEIKIKSINKYQQIPFVNYLDDGKRMYTNEARPDESLVVDRITLEDYIKFQKIKYEVIQGVYWSSFDNKMGEAIIHLYESRLEAKANDEKIKSEIIKLVMNSSYGKTLLKASKYRYHYVNKKDNYAYVEKNGNMIVSGLVVGNQICYKLYDNQYNHFNLAHVGVSILSMSKRIMNEVMDLANDNNIEIYYQDTDSMHMLKRDVEKLNNLYQEKYEKTLIGGYMEQFHSDFEMKGSKGEIISIKCIILGKKCYMDTLIDSEGKEGHHIRMKSVGSKVILANYKDPVDVYDRLFAGELLPFDLCKGGLKWDFIGTNVVVKDKFVRNIGFFEEKCDHCNKIFKCIKKLEKHKKRFKLC